VQHLDIFRVFYINAFKFKTKLLIEIRCTSDFILFSNKVNLINLMKTEINFTKTLMVDH